MESLIKNRLSEVLEKCESETESDYKEFMTILSEIVHQIPRHSQNQIFELERIFNEAIGTSAETGYRLGIEDHRRFNTV